MLYIGWVFNGNGSHQSGFRELVVALANAPHESLFSTELVKILTKHFWSRYFKTIIIWCFIPFIINFFTVLLYLSYFTVKGSSALDGKS